MTRLCSDLDEGTRLGFDRATANTNGGLYYSKVCTGGIEFSASGPKDVAGTGFPVAEALEELPRVAAPSLLWQAVEQVLAFWRFERARRWRPSTRIASASADGLAVGVLSSPTSGVWRAQQ